MEIITRHLLDTLVKGYYTELAKSKAEMTDEEIKGAVKASSVFDEIILGYKKVVKK